MPDPQLLELLKKRARRLIEPRPLLPPELQRALNVVMASGARVPDDVEIGYREETDPSAYSPTSGGSFLVDPSGTRRIEISRYRGLTADPFSVGSTIRHEAEHAKQSEGEGHNQYVSRINKEASVPYEERESERTAFDAADQVRPSKAQYEWMSKTEPLSRPHFPWSPERAIEGELSWIDYLMRKAMLDRMGGR